MPSEWAVGHGEADMKNGVVLLDTAQNELQTAVDVAKEAFSYFKDYLSDMTQFVMKK